MQVTMAMGRARGRRWLSGGNTLNSSFLAWLTSLFRAGCLHFFFRLINTLEAGGKIIAAKFFLLDLLNLIVRRLKMAVGKQENRNFKASFQFVHFGTLFIEKVGGDIDRHLSNQLCSIAFQGFFLKQA